jgi:hypothetical protein
MVAKHRLITDGGGIILPAKPTSGGLAMRKFAVSSIAAAALAGLTFAMSALAEDDCEWAARIAAERVATTSKPIVTAESVKTQTPITTESKKGG